MYDKLLESIIQSTVENAVVVHQYPRTTIAVTVQEMQDRGNVIFQNTIIFFDTFILKYFIFVFSCYPLV